MLRLTAVVVSVLSVWCAGSCAAEDMGAVVARALDRHPRIQAMRGKAERAAAALRETDGFLDPRLYAVAGGASWSRAIPGTSASLGVASRSVELAGGVEYPLLPGAYIGIGGAERWFLDPDTDDGDLYRTVAGVRLRVPLARDRGLRQWKMARAESLAGYERALNELRAEAQRVRLDVERAYITAQEKLASLGVAREATVRFRRLLEDTEQMAALKVVPEYQVAPARMELELRREEERQALQASEAGLLRLAESAGGDPVEIGEAVDLLALALAAPMPDGFRLEEALRCRGDYLVMLSDMAQTQARILKADDAGRPDVALEAASTWQGEDPNRIPGAGDPAEEDPFGGEIGVVWTRPLGYRAERARRDGERARLDEQRALLADLKLRIQTQIEESLSELAAARDRLEIAARAVESAEKTLADEEERFRLGEGRSRNVIDAQRDLTALRQRQTGIAAQLLRSRSSYLFATGYARETATENGESTP